MIFLIFLFKTLIVGICKNLLEPREAVLTCTHNLCFGLRIQKFVYPCKRQFYFIKVGF